MIIERISMKRFISTFIVLVSLLFLLLGCDYFDPVGVKDPVTGEVTFEASQAEKDLKALGDGAGAAGDVGLPYGKVAGSLFLLGVAYLQEKRRRKEKAEKEQAQEAEKSNLAKFVGLVSTVDQAFAKMAPESVEHMKGRLSEVMPKELKTAVKAIR